MGIVATSRRRGRRTVRWRSRHADLVTVATSRRKRCGRCGLSIRKHFSRHADLGTVATSKHRGRRSIRRRSKFADLVPIAATSNCRGRRGLSIRKHSRHADLGKTVAAIETRRRSSALPRAPALDRWRLRIG